jgi:glutathione synthase/RimK-type ligase-like ATP-grasp enzyme
MILLYTSKNEPNCELIIDEANALGLKWIRVNAEDEYENGRIGLSLENKCSIFGLSQTQLEQVTSVWCRKKTLLPIEHEDENIRKFIQAEANDVLQALPLFTAKAKWVNDLHYNNLARITANQLVTAKNIGLRVPKTLVTQSKQQLTNFYNQCNEQIICKVLHNQAPHLYGYSVPATKLVELQDIKELSSYFQAPTLFQECIDYEVEFRATVVDEQVFSVVQIPLCNNSSKTVDIRFNEKRFAACQLPEDIQTRLIKLVKSLNLYYAAIDIALTKDGEYVLFEVNPSGQWAWVETATNLPITRSIVKCLTTLS